MSSDLPRELAEQLSTTRFGREVQWHYSVGSTNTIALQLANDGAPEGLVVWADHQTTGRGRHGRNWHDSPGHNLLFSTVLRPSLPTELTGLIPLAAGLAVSQAIEIQSGLQTNLKWPNDVLINTKKVCGMLMEGQISHGENSQVMVLGIGLNVNQTEFAAEVESKATSLILESGQPVSRPALLAELLRCLEFRYDQLQAGDYDTIRNEFELRMTLVDASISVSPTATTMPTEGVVLGIAADGALRIETVTGEQRVHAGDISFSPLA